MYANITPDSPLSFNYIQCVTILTMYMQLTSDFPVNFTVFKDCNDIIDYMSVWNTNTINKTIIDAYQYDYCILVSSNVSTGVNYNLDTKCANIISYDNCMQETVSSIMVTTIGLILVFFVVYNYLFRRTSSTSGIPPTNQQTNPPTNPQGIPYGIPI